MINVVLELIALQTLDGRIVHVNPQSIVTLVEKIEEKPNTLLPKGVHCLIGLRNGSFISVAETCGSLRQRLEGR